VAVQIGGPPDCALGSNVSLATTSKTFTPLSAGTTYGFSLCAVDSSGFRSTPLTLTTTTTQSTPPPGSCFLDGNDVPTGQKVTAFFVSETTSACKSIQRTCKNGTLDGDASYQFRACRQTNFADTPSASSCIFDGRPIPTGFTISAFANYVGPNCVSETRTCGSDGHLSGTFLFAGCFQSSVDLLAQTCQQKGGGFSIMAYKSPTEEADGSCHWQMRNCANSTLSGTYSYLTCSKKTNLSSLGAPCDFASLVHTAPDGTQSIDGLLPKNGCQTTTSPNPIAIQDN
jgi:hypothetical protein